MHNSLVRKTVNLSAFRNRNKMVRLLLLSLVFPVSFSSVNMPVRANPALGVMQDAKDVLNYCDDIVENKLAESIIENKYETSSEEAIRSARAYQAARNEHSQTSGGFLGINVGRESSNSSSEEGSSEDIHNLNKNLLRYSMLQGKTVDPTKVGQECKSAVDAYNGMVGAFFTYLTVQAQTDGEVAVAGGQQRTDRHLSNNQLRAALSQHDVDKYALETERRAIEMQAEMAKQQLRAQRLDSILASFKQIAFAPRPQTPPPYYPQYQPPYGTPGFNPQSQHPAQGMPSSGSQDQINPAMLQHFMNLMM